VNGSQQNTLKASLEEVNKLREPGDGHEGQGQNLSKREEGILKAKRNSDCGKEGGLELGVNKKTMSQAQ